MISINEKFKKISIYDESNNILGYFTIHHLIKYLGDIYDTKKQFLKDIDINKFKEAKIIIKSFLFKLKYNKKNKYTEIMLFDYIHSAFMGDIEILVRLNNFLYLYQQNDMNSDLSPVDISNRNKIEQNIRKFIFILLNYTLKLIAIISEKINNDQNKQDLKENLLKYSIVIVYRINIFVQEQLKIINNQNNNLKKNLKENHDIKNIIKDKLNILLQNPNESDNLICSLSNEEKKNNSLIKDIKELPI